MAEPKKVKPKVSAKVPAAVKSPSAQRPGNGAVTQPAGNQAAIAALPEGTRAPIPLPRAQDFGPGMIMGNDQEYVQMEPQYNFHARDRRSGQVFTPPSGGGVIRVGGQSYEFDANKNLIRATSSALTAGIRDRANYANRSGEGRGLDFFHVLGIDFGHRDGRIQEYGGFAGPAYLNRDTGEGRTPLWYNAEREARKIAEKLHGEGKDYLIEVEAPNWQNGRPEKMRIRVWSGGKVIDPPDGPAAWVEIPQATLKPIPSETAPLAVIKQPLPPEPAPAKKGEPAKAAPGNEARLATKVPPVEKASPSIPVEPSLETPKPVETGRLPEAPMKGLPPASMSTGRTIESGRSESLRNEARFDMSPVRRQLYEQVGTPDMAPLNSGGPSSHGEAMMGAGQLLIEVEEVLNREAAVRDARYSGSLRTLRWWLQRGVVPPATGITDRWFSNAERTDNIDAIASGVKEGRFQGIEVGKLSQPQQYEAFEEWVTANIHSLEDLYLHFVYHLDSGVRWNLSSNQWEVTTWEWGEWGFNNVSKTRVQDERINTFMEGVRTRVMIQNENAIDQAGNNRLPVAQDAQVKIAGKRSFRSDGWNDRSLYDPYTMGRLMFRSQWSSPPSFYEIAAEGIPDGYVLVTGADSYTYFNIHHFRSLYGFVAGEQTTIGAPPKYDMTKPNTGWHGIHVPVALVKKEALSNE